MTDSRITRLIIYEGSDLQLAKQLGNSLSEGIHTKVGIKITIIKLSSEPILDGFIQETVKDFKDGNP